MLALLALSIAPGLFLLILVYLKDKYEPEPIRLLLKAFFYGAVSAFLLLALWVVIKLVFGKNVVFDSVYLNALFEAFVYAAIPEEAIKFVFFLIFFFKLKDFNEWFDGIVYASAISLGFATIENIFYVFAHGTTVGIMRAFFAVPAHFITGVTQGFFFSLAKFGNKRFLHLALALLSAIVIHGLYDFFLLLDQWKVFALFLLYFIAIVYLAKKLIIRQVEKSQFKPQQQESEEKDSNDPTA